MTVAVCSRSFSANQQLRAELLAQFPQSRFNDTGKSLEGQELVEFLRGSEKAIIALETINDQVLAELPELKVIGKYGVGLDKLDFTALERRGVKVGWTAGVNAQSVAELALAMSLNIVRNIPESRDLAKSGGWKQITGRQLSSLKVGVLGCGHVGKKLVKLLSAFGCEILVHDLVPMPEFLNQYNARPVNFDSLFRESDLVSIHLPKNRLTQNLIDAKVLRKMPVGSYLVNTARGGLVDEVEVLRMLEDGHLRGVAFDVFAEEPPMDQALIGHPRCFPTTHIGGSSQEAILAMGRAAIEGLNHSIEAKEFVELYGQ